MEGKNSKRRLTGERRVVWIDATKTTVLVRARHSFDTSCQKQRKSDPECFGEIGALGVHQPTIIRSSVTVKKIYVQLHLLLLLCEDKQLYVFVDVSLFSTVGYTHPRGSSLNVKRYGRSDRWQAGTVAAKSRTWLSLVSNDSVFTYK